MCFRDFIYVKCLTSAHVNSTVIWWPTLVRGRLLHWSRRANKSNSVAQVSCRNRNKSLLRKNISLWLSISCLCFQAELVGFNFSRSTNHFWCQWNIILGVLFRHVCCSRYWVMQPFIDIPTLRQYIAFIFVNRRRYFWQNWSSVDIVT